STREYRRVRIRSSFSRRAADRTLISFSGLTPPRSLSTRSTVAVETLASRATSAMIGFRDIAWRSGSSRHCEERSDEAIQEIVGQGPWPLNSFASLAMTTAL